MWFEDALRRFKLAESEFVKVWRGGSCSVAKLKWSSMHYQLGIMRAEIGELRDRWEDSDDYDADLDIAERTMKAIDAKFTSCVKAT